MGYKMLIISMYLPFDNVGHAGGKTHNYYLKKFHTDENFEVRLITFGSEADIQKSDLDRYGIQNEVILFSKKFFKKLKRALVNIRTKTVLFDKYAGMLTAFLIKNVIKKIKDLRKNGYNPDIIILEWTQIVLMVGHLKRYYPDAVLVASEHDVSFLGAERAYINEKNLYIKWLNKIKYERLKKSEVNALKLFDLVVPHNFKDYYLLKDNGIKETNLDYIVPFYMDLFALNPDYKSKNLIYFGDMSRMENYECCIWFIKNVFSKITLINKECKFIIIGGNPPEKLKIHSSDNIIVTGFVKDIQLYFENALCMVAPLLLGAGIKVKLLEAMSAGLPVLTNEIGIEGIPAVDKVHYLHCRDVNDYVETIKELLSGVINASEIGNNCRKLIKDEFNLEKSYDSYKELILSKSKNRLIDAEIYY